MSLLISTATIPDASTGIKVPAQRIGWENRMGNGAGPAALADSGADRGGPRTASRAQVTGVVLIRQHVLPGKRSNAMTEWIRADQARRQDRTLRPRLDSSHCRTWASVTVGGTGSDVEAPSSHWTTTVRQP